MANLLIVLVEAYRNGGSVLGRFTSWKAENEVSYIVGDVILARCYRIMFEGGTEFRDTLRNHLEVKAQLRDVMETIHMLATENRPLLRECDRL